MNILSIDQGTSGTKAVVTSGDEVRAIAEISIRPDYRADGGVVQDPKELWDSVYRSASQAMAQADIPLDGVALTNQGESVLAWNPETGEPLTPLIVWQDRRAEGICAALAEYKGLVAKRTGLVLDPYFTAPKMTWLRRNLTTEGVVTTSDTWLVYKLCGAFVTDASTASRSAITNLDTGAWDDELLDLFGLGQEKLPRIVPNDAVIGQTRLFGTQVPVAGLIVDQQAALAAEACTEAGEAKCTFGTGAFLLENTGDLATRPTEGLVSCVAWNLRGRTSYCLDGQVYTAASAVRWIQDLGIIESPRHMDAVAAKDPGDVLCVPALAGLAAPWWRPDAAASFTGLKLSTGKGELVLALLQGLAAQVAELADLTAKESGRSIDVLRVDGGLTNSRVLMQAVADFTQARIDVFPSAHATPLGAVAMARMALDPSLSLDEAVVAWKPSTTFEPLWSKDRAAEFRARWRAAVEATLVLKRPK
jgi:glycerol kinase